MYNVDNSTEFGGGWAHDLMNDEFFTRLLALATHTYLTAGSAVPGTFRTLRARTRSGNVPNGWQSSFPSS